MRPCSLPGVTRKSVARGDSRRPSAHLSGRAVRVTRGSIDRRFGTPTVNWFGELVLPVSLYTVAVPDPWLETQSGLPVEKENPQGLIRFGSVRCAGQHSDCS